MVNERVSVEKERIAHSRSVIRSRPLIEISQHEKEISSIAMMVSHHTKLNFSHESSKLRLLEEQLRLLDPKTILKRGFSITYHNNKPITDIRNVKIGHELRTEFYVGRIKSTVISKEENDG